MSEALRSAIFGPREVTREVRPDGSMIIKSTDPLGPYPKVITECLVQGAADFPDRVLYGQRVRDGAWRTVTYKEGLAQVESIGQALLDRGLSKDRPVLILSANGIDHALLHLAGLHVGIPTAAISTAYSLISEDFGKLRHVFDILTPGLIFAEDGTAYERAFEALHLEGVECVISRNPVSDRAATAFSDLCATPVTDAVAQAHAAIDPDDVAKFLFTSGSTGVPKGVINTHRMMCCNQRMMRQMLGLMGEVPPVMLDWLPWSHTFGGNHNIGIALYNGGSFHIDEGKPVGKGILATIANLRDINPTLYFNVPKGYEELLPHLRADKALREGFFKDLRVLFYAGAGMAPHIWDAYDTMAEEVIGQRIFMCTSLGSTETAPFAFCTPWDPAGPGEIGIPGAGVEVKLVPSDEKLELRLRGPNITPGYWRQPHQTQGAFDEEGFYKMGDALKFADPEDPSRGFLFDGRIAEDFKLATGTWVSVGPLRAKIIGHFAPFVRDAVITGHDRDDVGMLLLPDMEQCRNLCVGLPDDASDVEVLRHHSVLEELHGLLRSLASHATGSANKVVRAAWLEVPPDLDAGEITDKGSLNQRAILRLRGDLVDQLYSDNPPRHMVSLTWEMA
ncbi:MAG: feruloyl-CoA synthase [Rhodospirillum sp.]|nr:feruloyl-CoA synthase [Rhodospirillum sp.]MCF8489774.1 feruloyl-CoA synthase [Rhodospirillum sp.]MCF8502947.1 feruloyl-CoA synthase [Rhodospirillum sp.]